MSNQSASFHTVHPNPDYTQLRAQLGALPGVSCVELDWNSREVTVAYNDEALSYTSSTMFTLPSALTGLVGRLALLGKDGYNEESGRPTALM